MLVVESGQFRGPLTSYRAGDLLSVRVGLNGRIEYAIGNRVLTTSAGKPQFPLYVDASLHTANTQVARARWIGKAEWCDGVLCSALDACHLAGTCSEGVCSNPPASPRPCNDGLT